MGGAPIVELDEEPWDCGTQGGIIELTIEELQALEAELTIEELQALEAEADEEPWDCRTQGGIIELTIEELQALEAKADNNELSLSRERFPGSQMPIDLEYRATTTGLSHRHLRRKTSPHTQAYLFIADSEAKNHQRNEHGLQGVEIPRNSRA